MNLRIRRNTTYFIQHCRDLLGIIHRLYIIEREINYRAGTPQMLQGVTHRVGMSGESGPMAASLSSLHIHPYVHTTDIKSNSA